MSELLLKEIHEFISIAESGRDEISELKALIKQSVILSNGNPENIKNGNKIAVEEAERRMQNMALYESRQMRKGGFIQEEAQAVVGSLER